MKRLLLLCAGLALLSFGCGGGDKGAATGPVDAGSPTGSGIVTAVTGSAAAQEGLAEGQGALRLDVSHTDRLVNKSVVIALTDATGAAVAKVAGNESAELAPGTYSAAIEYKENDKLDTFEGAIEGLVVHPGNESAYKVSVEAPIGILRLRFTDGELPLNDRVTLTVYKAEDDPELVVGPVWTGSAGESVILPTNTYQVKAVFQPEKGSPITEWYKDLEVGKALARTEKDVVLELDLTGLRVDAFNYGRDVNARTRVFVYAEGADTQFAVAKFQGKAGEAIPADPGVYDVRVVYTPSDSALDFLGDKTVKAVKVNAGLGTRMQADVELELATIKVKVTDGEENLSDKTEIRVMRTGADRDAASPVVEELGVGTHPIPTDTVDITLTVKAEEKTRTEMFKGVELGNGWTWDQSFDLSEATWTPKAVLKPPAPLTPISWEPEGDDDDDSGAGDDDSAGDDDDSGAKAEEKPAEGGEEKPAEGK